jgi:outer membrane lipoprotein SlyB
MVRVNPERKEVRMKNTNSLRTVEPLAAVKKHPRAAAAGGAITAILCGVMATVVGGPVAGFMMAIIGAVVGAPGGAHLAEAAEEQERPL